MSFASIFDFRWGGSAPPEPPWMAGAALVLDYAATFLKFVQFLLKIAKTLKKSFRCVKIRKNREYQGFTFFGFLPP